MDLFEVKYSKVRKDVVIKLANILKARKLGWTVLTGGKQKRNGHSDGADNHQDQDEGGSSGT